jgi:hypothetical protein
LTAALAAVAALVAMPAFAGSNSTTLPNGAQLSVSINSPRTARSFSLTAHPFRFP